MGTSSANFPEKGLSKYQQYPVHRIISAEYPGFVTIGRPGFVQIVTPCKEFDHQKSRMTAFDFKLKRHVGVRWLAEALMGGDLATIARPEQSVPGEPKQQHEGLCDRLRAKKTILVGHNLFVELIYFHICFLGQLPNKVEDFGRRMHQLFPIIIDTKYLGTHGVEDPSPSRAKSSLDELDIELSSFHPASVLGNPKRIVTSVNARADDGF